MFYYVFIDETLDFFVLISEPRSSQNDAWKNVYIHINIYVLCKNSIKSEAKRARLRPKNYRVYFLFFCGTALIRHETCCEALLLSRSSCSISLNSAGGCFGNKVNSTSFLIKSKLRSRSSARRRLGLMLMLMLGTSLSGRRAEVPLDSHWEL